jgi:hypothetical protein
MPLLGCGGTVGAAVPVHHAFQPPIEAKAGVPSPPMPQPGYSVTPLAKGTGERHGERSVRTACTCASFRQLSPLVPAAQRRLAGSKRCRHATGFDTMRSATPSAASHDASTALCTSCTCAGRSHPSPKVAMPLRVPACCSPVQLITGTRLKMPSKSCG